MTYQPLSYGSREWLEVRKSVVTRQSRTKINGVPVIIEHQNAAKPGLWTLNSADLFTVLKSAGKIAHLGNATEVVASGSTRDEAVTKAKEKLS